MNSSRKGILATVAAAVLLFSSVLASPLTPTTVLAQETPIVQLFINNSGDCANPSVDSPINENPEAKWMQQVLVFVGKTADQSVEISWKVETPEEAAQFVSDDFAYDCHEYESSDIGTQQIAVNLLDSGLNVIGSTTLDVQILKRSTSIFFNPIDEVVVRGDSLAVSGTLADSDTGMPITGTDLKFSDSSGGVNIPTVTPNADDGSFTAEGTTPNLLEDGLVVSAKLDPQSDIYLDPVDELQYDTIPDPLTEGTTVESGAFVTAEFSGLGASVTFEDVETGGDLLAYDCNTGDNPRYLSLLESVCVNIRLAPDSTFQMADGSTANVTISVSPSSIPGENDITDLHMFKVHEGVSTADITLLIDSTSDSITGQTSSFSKFLLAIPDLPDETPNSLRVPVFLGHNEIDYRDITNKNNVSATFTISPTPLRVGKTATLTLSDPDSNINPDKIDSASVFVYSDSSFPDGITLTLNEVSDNSDLFRGTFDVVAGSTSGNELEVDVGDDITVNYTQSAGRLKIILDGVDEAGIVEILDYHFDPNEAVTFLPIGGAVEVHFLDVHLGDGGKATVKMSYANAVLQGQDPCSLSLFHQESGDWIDITDNTPNPDDTCTTTRMGLDQTAMTVGGETTSLSPFSVGVFTGVPGGAGGGGFTGRGVVVDAVASIARASSSGSGGSSSNTNSNTGSSTAFVANLAAGLGVELDAMVPPSSRVNLEFESVTTPGSITIEQRLVSSAASMFSEVTQNGAKIVYPGGLIFTSSGNFFEIMTSNTVDYDGSILITIPFDIDTLSEARTSDVRLLHYNGNEWEDVTISIDEKSGTVTGRVSSLSPVIAAVVNDGTFGSVYFDQNPMMKIIDVNPSTGIVDSSDSQIFLIGSDGSTADSAMLDSGKSYQIVNSIKNVQRTSQSYSYVVEVLDRDGVVVKLEEVQNGALAQGETEKIALDWTAPLVTGQYTIKIFVIDESSSQAPILLKDSLSTKVGVV